MLVVLTIAFGFPAVVILAYGGLPVNHAEPTVRAVTGNEHKATQGNPKQQPQEPNTTPSSANGAVGNTRSDNSGEDSRGCLERSGKYVRAVFAGVRWNDLHVFARVLQWLFIGTFASLPALLFYLFDRQRLSTLRSTFFRSVLSIHPCLATYGDAQSVYGARVDEAFGDVPRDIFESSGLDTEAKTYQPRTGRLRGAKRLIVVVATLVITIGWMLCLSPVGKPLDGTSNEIAVLEYFVPAPAPIVFAFLGAYVFSIGSLFRLYVCSDLRPKAYAHVCVRVVTAIALGWAISVIPVSCESLGKDRQTMESNQDPNRAVSTQGTAQQSTTPSRNDGNAPSGGPSEGAFHSWNSTDLGGYASLLLAFTIGAFPSLGFAIIREFLRSRYRIRTWVPPYKEQLPLHNLDGINMYQRARLLDEGIENIENLAHADLVELLLQTRFPVPTLVDWTDQAILHLHIRSMPPSLPAPSPQHADKASKGANDKQRATEAQDDSEYYLRDVRILQSYGIRTATDLLRAYDRSKKEEPHKTQFLSVLGPAESEPKRLKLVLDAIEDDEWMPHLRYHRSLKRFSHRLLTLEDAEKRMIEHGVLDIECHDWVSP
jgi:hypothetical protein